MREDSSGKGGLRHSLLWLGVGIPVFVFTLNGLHACWLNLPYIGLSLTLNQYLVDSPWSFMEFTPIYCSFAAIGFFFLLSSDLLFALWFFALLTRLQGVVAFAFGVVPSRMPMYGGPLFVGYQSVGAYFVLAAYMFYTAFPHLKRVFCSVVSQCGMDDDRELMPYRTACWGFVVALGLILFWCYMAGMKVWLAALEFGVFFFIVALVMARSTAEGGLLMTETTFRPVDIYRMIAPVHTLGAANLTLLAFLDGAFMRDQRGLLLTGFLDGLKMCDSVRLNRRAFLWVFALGLIVALFVAGFLHLYLPYTRGALGLYSYVCQGNPVWVFSDYQSQMLSLSSWTWVAPVSFGVGVVVTVFLAYMRAVFCWWPLHPLGYALGMSWTMTVFWFSCLVAWLAKVVVLRYGGMRLYVRLRPLFLGMVLGEFGMAVIWAIVSALTGAPAPEFPWP